MDGSQLTDEACEKLICGRLGADEDNLAPVGWFIEDLLNLYLKPPTLAARSLHPSAVSRPADPAIMWPPEHGQACKPDRSWWWPSGRVPTEYGRS